MKIARMVVFCALTVLLGGSALLAQVRPARGLGSGWSGGVSLGSAHVAVSVDGDVRIVDRVGATKVVHSFASGVPVPGGYDVQGTSSIVGMLVAGRNALGGVLVRWAFDAPSGTWQLTDSYTLPGGDFGGVVHVDGHLYLLECVTGCILGSAWDPDLQTFGELAMSVVATAVDVPGLAVPDLLTLYPLEAGSAPDLPGPGAFVHEIWREPIGQRGSLLRQSLGSTVVSSYTYDPLPIAPVALVDETQVAAGDDQVAVLAPPGLSFHIHAPHGGVIGSGVGDANGSALVSLSEPLAVGSVYSVREVGLAYGTAFQCVARFGFPEQLADGTQMQRSTIALRDAVVDNPDFGLSVPIRRATQGPRVGYAGLVIVGFLGMPILAVDNGQGVNAVLDSEFWIGAGGHIAEHALNGFVDMSFPIPNNPNLAGVVFLTQFVVGDALGLRLGEVLGFQIGPALH